MLAVDFVINVVAAFSVFFRLQESSTTQNNARLSFSYLSILARRKRAPDI